MDKAYVLHHTYGEAESETYKMLGVFLTHDLAVLAINSYLALPGFIDYPDGFTISQYVVNELYWSEGFEPGLDDTIEEQAY